MNALSSHIMNIVSDQGAATMWFVKNELKVRGLHEADGSLLEAIKALMDGGLIELDEDVLIVVT